MHKCQVNIVRQYNSKIITYTKLVYYNHYLRNVKLINCVILYFRIIHHDYVSHQILTWGKVQIKWVLFGMRFHLIPLDINNFKITYFLLQKLRHLNLPFLIQGRALYCAVSTFCPTLFAFLFIVFVNVFMPVKRISNKIWIYLTTFIILTFSIVSSNFNDSHFQRIFKLRTFLFVTSNLIHFTFNYCF